MIQLISIPSPNYQPHKSHATIKKNNEKTNKHIFIFVTKKKKTFIHIYSISIHKQKNTYSEQKISREA